MRYNRGMRNHKPILYTITSVLLFLMVFTGMATAAETPEKKSASQEAALMDNPLLKPFNTPFNAPPFDKIREEHYLPALTEAIRLHNLEIQAIIDNPASPDFANTVEALDRSGKLMDEIRAIFNSARSSNTNDKIQEISQTFNPRAEGHDDDINQNAALYKRFKAVYDKRDTLSLKEDQLRLLDDYHKDFVRGGAELSPEQKNRFKTINTELSKLYLQLSDNILAEMNTYKLVLEKKEDLAGLPEATAAAAAEAATDAGLKEKWLFTLHEPSRTPFLQFSERRDLREKLYNAYIQMGNNNNERDNKAIIAQIMTLRTEKARLMGFDNYGRFCLDVRMAKTPDRVKNLLKQIWNPSLDMARNDAREFQAMIDKEGGNFKLQPWDWWYYAEKQRKEKYNLDETAIKPYFQLEKVRDGVFFVANKLFGLQFIERKEIPVYHPDVKAFEVLEKDGAHLGVLFVDYHPRASKRSGAWAGRFRGQMWENGRRTPPVVTNNGNFTKPTANTPSLLRLEEVETLFHEFGHALHSLLANGRYRELSSVALDFVELPSQIMENWITRPEVLQVFARHYQTGEIIPQDLLDKIIKAQNFNRGFKNVEFLAACLLDQAWHSVPFTDPKTVDVLKFENDVMKEIGMIPEITSRYRSSYFRHVFTDSYPAGYYSYVWSEVLDADAFQAFVETGNIFDPATAERFRKEILEKGSSADEMEMFKRFRGAEPKIDALLKRYGMK